MDSTSLPVPEHFWFCCVATPSFELPPGDLAWALHLLDSLFLPRPPSHPRVHLADIDTSIPRSWSGVAWPTHSTRFAVGAADRRVLDPPTRRPFYCRSDHRHGQTTLQPNAMHAGPVSVGYRVLTRPPNSTCVVDIRALNSERKTAAARLLNGRRGERVVSHLQFQAFVSQDPRGGWGKTSRVSAFLTRSEAKSSFRTWWRVHCSPVVQRPSGCADSRPYTRYQGWIWTCRHLPCTTTYRSVRHMVCRNGNFCSMNQATSESVWFQVVYNNRRVDLTVTSEKVRAPPVSELPEVKTKDPDDHTYTFAIPLHGVRVGSTIVLTGKAEQSGRPFAAELFQRCVP